MSSLLIVSNRLPITVAKGQERLYFKASVGGLATGLGSFYRSFDGKWVGWPGIAAERIEGNEERIRGRLRSESCFPIFLTEGDVEGFYDGFCNRTLWPLFHYFTQFTEYNEKLWEAYRKVNELFCDEVLRVAGKDDTIWIHDYHLMLLPGLLRDRLPEAKIGFFLHIPFPSFEVFRLLPWRIEILKGLLGADLIGFHTYDYVQYFLDSIRRLLGYEHALGQITTSDRVIKVDAFPMGISFEKFAQGATERGVKREIERIRRKVGDRKIVLSIDRLDYTKGIPKRLEAFDIFLQRYPEYIEKITLILVAVPSRTGVEHYAMLKREVDELIGRINGKYSTIGWSPIWYLYRFLAFPNLVALYSVADVALVTPLRDGMNLIAKEFIATKTDGRGVLILSEMAGAAKELGEAITVNPNNEEEVAEALREALEMSEEEQVARNKIMQRRLQRYNVIRWATEFMEKLEGTKDLQKEFTARRLTQEVLKRLIDDYRRSERRLIFLDYDGTLIPFSEKPNGAKPDGALLKTLETIAKDRGTEVVIVSGRDKESIERWFGGLNVSLIAEHGVWIKEKGGEWELIEPMKSDWKEQIRPILESYMDRTPGSFIEEKEFSLVWHYRRADPELASVRARELRDALFHLTANLDIGVLEGSKVVEIKNLGINKGKAAMRWISKEEWDFILAVGDDWTDEDLFAALPEKAYSIRVGLGPSKSRFNVTSYTEIRSLLQDLSRDQMG